MAANVGTAYVDIKPDFSQLNRELAQKMGPIANQFGGRLGKALGPVMAQQTKHLRTFTTGAKYAAVGGAGLAVVVGRDLVQAGMKFEQQMDTNAAVSEANRKEMAALERQSIQLGKATFFSANEAAEAQAELVKGGLSIQQILGGGLPAALNLAEAGSLGLATAAETTVNAMKLFGLEGKEAGSVADMLTTAANRTTADVLDYAMAMKQGGSVTKLAGYEMNETVTVLEALAEAGIKNSDAGTSMKAAVIQLLKPSEKQEKLARLLGIHWETQNGELKSAAGLSKELRIATDGMTKAERAKTLATLAGTDGVRTLNALYASSPKQLEALERANRKQGTAQDIARKKMDNVAGAIEQFKGSIETAEIQIYKGMAPALGTLSDEATDAVNAIGAIFEDPDLSGSEKVEAAIDKLGEELGTIWDRHEMTENLVDLMEAAIPVIAEHAGQLGLEFAEGFARGFVHADFLGKAVMATWLLHFIGGKAPFVAIGKSMGKQFGFSFATEATATAATAGGGVARTAAAGAVTGGAAAQAAWLGTDSWKQREKLQHAGMRSVARQTAAEALAAQGGIFSTLNRDIQSKWKVMGARLARGATTWGLGGYVVGGIAQEVVGGDTGAKLASAFQGAGAGAMIGSAIAPGIGTAIGAALGGTGGILVDVLGDSDGKNLGSEYAEEVIKGLQKQMPELRRQFRTMDLGKAGTIPSDPEKAWREIPGRPGQLPRRVGGSGLRGTRASLQDELNQALRWDADPELTKALEQQIKAITRVIKSGERTVASYRKDLDLLRSGSVVRLEDISTVTQRSLGKINQLWKDNPPKWRKATASSLRATIAAIGTGIDKGAIDTKAGMARIRRILHRVNLLEGNDPFRIAKGFEKGWLKAGGVSDRNIKKIKHDLALMPKPAQEAAQDAMIRMARTLEKQGKLPEGAAARLRSGLVTRFGETGRSMMKRFEREGVIGAKRGLKGILRIFAGNDPLMISKAFARSWDKSNGINEKQIQRAVRVLRKLPKPAREAAKEAMTQMADEMQRSGKIKEGADNLRSALTAAFGKGGPREIRGLKGALAELSATSGKTFDKLEGGSRRYAERLGKTSTAQGNFARSATKSTGTAGTVWDRFADRFNTQSAQPFKGDVGSMSTTAKGAMNSMAQLANEVLKGFGVEAAEFGVKGKEQKRQEGGFIVPGTGSGDTFKTTLPVGSFIENREAVRKLPLGFQGGGEVPVALEPGERVWLPPAVKAAGQHVLEHRNSLVPRFGFQKGGSLGPEPQMTGPAGALRSVGQAAIGEVYKGAKDYIEKNRPQVSTSGVPGYIGPPPGMKQLGDNAWVDSHTLAVANLLASKFGSTITDGWRPQNASYGATNSSHKRGTPDNPGAVDLAPPSTALQTWAGQHIAGLTENDIHDWGTGLHNHIAFFRLGGLIQHLSSGGFVDANETQKNVALAIGRNLLPRGLNYKGAAAIIGNAWRESLWDPASIGTGGRGLYGFDFFEEELLAEAEKQGRPWTDIDFQNDFMWSGPEPAKKLMGALNSQPNAAAGAEYFDTYWEKSGVKAMSDRKNGAREAMRLMTGSNMEGGNTDEHSYKEDIPAVFKGAKTGSLDFPPVPKNLPAIDREITRWENQRKIYRRAKGIAEDKNRPGLAQAIGKNLTEIENHLRKLHNAKTNLRAEMARRKLTRQLAAKIGRFGDYEVGIERKARTFREASEEAERIVAREPQLPELANTATDGEREAAEKAWLANYKSYIKDQEEPFYGGMFNLVGDWRNEILRAEYFGWAEGKKPSATRVEGTWEKKVREIQAEIEAAQKFSEQVAKEVKEYKADHPEVKTADDYPKWLKEKIAKRDRLNEKVPFLRFEDKELRKSLGEARGFFFPGGKDRISPPSLPLEGTGSFEDRLIEVQGTHWLSTDGKPDAFHTLLPASALVAPGQWGGEIAGLQDTVKDLGLKVNQAANSLTGPGEDSTKGEHEELLRELLTQSNQEQIIRQIEARVLGNREDYLGHFQLGGLAGSLPPYAGKAHTGAIVPGPRTQERTMIVKGREGIFTEEQMAALGGGAVAAPQGDLQLSVVIYEDGTAEAKLGEKDVEAIIERRDRRQARGAGRPRAGRPRRL